MIYELQIRDPKTTPVPHWPKVTWLKNLTNIQFKPGLNIIYGQNGTGKSTLITALATLLHCKDSNWPMVSKVSLARFLRPAALAEGLLLSHDGAPARYLGFEDPGFTPEKGISQKELILEAVSQGRGLHMLSSGQATVNKLVRFLSAEPEKTKRSITAKTAAAMWKDVYEVGTESLKNVTSKPGVPKQPVILLDEPDRSLDFAKQGQVWRQLRALATDHQIIIASHSPFAVSVPGAHYIETTPNYLAASRAALALLLEDAPREEKDAAE